MITKRFDRKGQWGIDSAKRYFHREFVGSDFTGIMALLYFDDIKNPSQWEHTGKPVTVCDKGMKWLQFIPRDENYAVMTMIDKDNEISLWYINVIADYGFTNDNVIYIIDLHVDIILYPDGTYIADDANEELNEALEENEITYELYDLALKTKVKIINGLVLDPDALARFSMKYLQKMEKSNNC